MIYSNVGINSITWSNAGTSIEIGYRYSESDGDEDDWTLASCNLNVSNDETDFFFDQLADKFRDRITAVINEDLKR